MAAFPFCESGFGTGDEEIQFKSHLDETRVLLAASAKIWSLFSLEVAPTTAYIPALYRGKRLEANSLRSAWLFFSWVIQKELPVERWYRGLAERTWMKVSSHNLSSVGNLRWACEDVHCVKKDRLIFLLFFFVKIWYPEILTSYRALLLPDINKGKFMENITTFSSSFLLLKQFSEFRISFTPL